MSNEDIKLYMNVSHLKQNKDLHHTVYPASSKYLYQKSTSIYEEQILWEIIESWIRENSVQKDINILYLSLMENENLANYIVEDLVKETGTFKISSFINFIRYYPILVKYVSKDNYDVSIVNEIIRLKISNKNLHLVLHFRSDFLVEFYSYDNDFSDEESLVYSMQGSFSSSSKISKSYKIERLLALFDRCNDEFSNFYTLSINK